ncbi:MAG TPA: ATP-binding protein [Limnochordales bacterium]
METSVRSQSLIRFPSAEPKDAAGDARLLSFTPAARVEPTEAPASLSVRLAVYPPDGGLPAVYDVCANETGALLAEACRRSAQWVKDSGSPVPVEAVVAVVENLIHAHFQLATVSIAPDGSVTVSDQGPGIPDKRRALLPGFTTATAQMRRYIRGVGSGLTIAATLMERVGGQLRIEDNLAGGTVVTLSPRRVPSAPSVASAPSPQGSASVTPASPSHRGVEALTARQRRLLLLAADLGEIGPSAASQHLGMSLTTAFRELVVLEGLGLVAPNGAGKRRLTPDGAAAVEQLLSQESLRLSPRALA